MIILYEKGIFMEELAKVLPKMKKFDAYINDVKKDNFPIFLSGLSDSQKVHFAYSTRFYTERPILIITYNDIQLKKIYEDLKFFEDEERLKLWNDTGYMQLAKYLKK